MSVLPIGKFKEIALRKARGWAIAAIFAAFFVPAGAQHNHGAGHSEYMGWASRKVANCCDDRDCGMLSENEIRETKTGTEILIGGEWCPVLPEHWLTKGKSPDSSVAHACINPAEYTPACSRLLCFVPKALH